MKRHNPENDKWFLTRVKRGVLSVTKLGLVVNNVTGRVIGATGSGGYPKISMKDCAADKIRHMQIHRLVWIVYRGHVPEDRILNHKDGNKENRRLSNLELVTDSGNVQHAIKHGLHRALKGEANKMSKFSDAQVARLRQRFAKANGRMRPIDGARKLKVSPIIISFMLRGRTYKHVVTGYEKACTEILDRKNTRKGK